MRIIKLTKGKETIVDDDTFNKFGKLRWHISTCGYAVRSSSRKLGKQKKIYLHREILNPNKNQLIDHVDENRLNNQRNNLRLCNT